MQIEEILSYWETDCKIDELDLQKSAREIPELHSKYLRFYMTEKSELIRLKAGFKRLKLKKYEFLINPDEDGVKMGWTIPPQGKLLKNETGLYLEGDKDLLTAEVKVTEQEEKVEILRDIMKAIRERNFIIRNIIEDRKFMEGH